MTEAERTLLLVTAEGVSGVVRLLTCDESFRAVSAHLNDALVGLNAGIKAVKDEITRSEATSSNIGHG